MHYIDDNNKELGQVSFITTEMQLKPGSVFLDPSNWLYVHKFSKLRLNSATSKNNEYYYYTYDGQDVKSPIPYVGITDDVLEDSVRILRCMSRDRNYIEFLGHKVERRYHQAVPYKYYSVPYVVIPDEFSNVIMCGRAFYDSTTDGFLMQTVTRSVHYNTQHSIKDISKKAANFVTDYDNIPPIIKLLQNPKAWEHDVSVFSVKDRLIGNSERRNKSMEYMLRFSEYFFDEHAMTPATSSIALLYERQSTPFKRHSLFKAYRQLTAEECLVGVVMSSMVTDKIMPHYAKI